MPRKGAGGIAFGFAPMSRLGPRQTGCFARIRPRYRLRLHERDVMRSSPRHLALWLNPGTTDQRASSASSTVSPEISAGYAAVWHHLRSELVGAQPTACDPKRRESSALASRSPTKLSSRRIAWRTCVHRSLCTIDISSGSLHATSACFDPGNRYFLLRWVSAIPYIGLANILRAE
jgi:hypothetical protein